MEEKSLRIYTQKTFFSKLGTTISKIFTCVNWEWVNPELNYCLKN